MKPDITPKIRYVYLFSNRNLAVIDCEGIQVPELQGRVTIEKLKRILENSDINTVFKFNSDWSNPLIP